MMGMLPWGLNTAGNKHALVSGVLLVCPTKPMERMLQSQGWCFEEGKLGSIFIVLMSGWWEDKKKSSLSIYLNQGREEPTLWTCSTSKSLEYFLKHCHRDHEHASFPPQRKLLVATSLIVAVSLFVVVANYSEKPYFRLQPMFRQGFSSHWMFSKAPYKGFKPHLGYVSIPKQEVRYSLLHMSGEPLVSHRPTVETL